MLGRYGYLVTEKSTGRQRGGDIDRNQNKRGLNLLGIQQKVRQVVSEFSCQVTSVW